MLKAIKFCTIGVFAVGLLLGFYLWPSGDVVSEPGNSPLYAASLNTTTTQISGNHQPEPAEVDGKGGGQGNLVTCETTCGPTCNQTTCGTTCVATCASTCANTCAQTTCNSTCVATCAATCANTCEQATCNSTCVVTCSYTCEEPITLAGFSAMVKSNGIELDWVTGSEVDNYSFVLYRSTERDNQNSYVNISGEIQAKGQVGNTEYSYMDHEVVPGVTYYYKIADISIYGNETLHSTIVSARVPKDVMLAQNYPNPFNPETVIRFEVPDQAQTQLKVYDMNGRLVRTLVDGTVEAGSHQVSWNASNDAGQILPSGMYVYRLTAGSLTASGKMVFVK